MEALHRRHRDGACQGRRSRLEATREPFSGLPCFVLNEGIIRTCWQGPNAGGAPLKEMIAMIENLFAFVAAVSGLGSFILQLVRELNAREEDEGKKNGR